MKVHFYAPESGSADLKRDYEVIQGVLRRADAWVSSNLDRRPVHLPPEDVARAEAAGEPLLEQMDALVINGSRSDQQAGYLVAYAITTRKPTLFLYRRGSVPELFKHLSTREVPKWIRVFAYTPKNLERGVREFLSGLSGAPVREIPRIKFTLRITRTIERFLNFKTANTKQTKADWLREQIEKLMEKDGTWRRFNRED